MSAQRAFKLQEITAAGTFGTVCIAQDLDRGTLVALKVLKDAHLNRPRVIARTRDEATMLARINHPCIVQVEGLMQIEDRPVLIMEWVRGLSIEQVLKVHRLGFPAPVAVELIRQSTLALGAAYHALDVNNQPMHIIHRDIKPSNLLISVAGELKVVDFGIARAEFEEKEAQTMSMVLGARGYLAPERLDGHDDHPTGDIYSLGICLYEFLTGRHVVLSVHRDYHTEALEKHLRALEVPDLDAASTERVRSIIRKMCAYESDNRPNHEALVGELDALINDCGLVADLPAFARSQVFPLFRDRTKLRPIDHPAYPELAFIERMARMVTYPAPPDVDQELRVFLRAPDWHTRTEQLEFLLTNNPHWSAAPFLEILPTGNRSWWQFWGGKEVPPEQIVAVLDILAERPEAEIRERALQLQRHTSPKVVEAACRLLDTDPGAIS